MSKSENQHQTDQANEQTKDILCTSAIIIINMSIFLEKNICNGMKANNKSNKVGFNCIARTIWKYRSEKQTVAACHFSTKTKSGN